MLYEERIETTPLEDTLGAPESSQDALERGAARRRRGRAGSPPTPYGLAESRPASRPSLHAVSELRSPLEPVRDKVDESLWRARLESDLKSVRATLAGLQATVGDDREAMRAAGEQAWLHATKEWLAELGRVESRLERAEGQLSDLQPAVRGAAERRNDTAGLTESAQRIEALEHTIGNLAEKQAELREALAVLSQSFVARRLTTTTLYMGGIALALISAAVWLFTKSPSIF